MTQANENDIPDLAHGDEAYRADVVRMRTESDPEATEADKQFATEQYWDAVERHVQSEGDGFAPQPGV